MHQPDIPRCFPNNSSEHPIGVRAQRPPFSDTWSDVLPPIPQSGHSSMAQQPPLHLLSAFPSVTPEHHPAEPASSAALEGQPTHWSGFLLGGPTREPHQTWKEPPCFGALAHNGMEALNESPHQIQKVPIPPIPITQLTVYKAP